MDEIGLIIEKIINLKTYKIILSNPVNKDSKYKKVHVKLKKDSYQIESFTETQVFHQNMSFYEIKEYLIEAIKSDFRQLNAWDDMKEHSVKVSNKGKILTNSVASKIKPKLETGHNREKNYILKEGEQIPALIDMGIFTKEGKVVKSMYDKYRQINRFVEIIDDEIERLDSEKQLHIVDFGCGKSYLTFVLYYYFKEIKKLDIRMTGLDLKNDVIRKCNESAEKYGYSNLKFEIGDINGYKFNGETDMVITLHACDTATDYALYNAIKSDAKMIFSVPCCQHELNNQIKSDDYSILTKYGIIKERTAALMTDAIRANLLEYCGYKTQLLEFIDLTHTPKNILIRAVKTNIPESKKKESIRDVEKLMEEFHLEPTLYKLILQSE